METIDSQEFQVSISNWALVGIVLVYRYRGPRAAHDRFPATCNRAMVGLDTAHTQPTNFPTVAITIPEMSCSR